MSGASFDCVIRSLSWCRSVLPSFQMSLNSVKRALTQTAGNYICPKCLFKASQETHLAIRREVGRRHYAQLVPKPDRAVSEALHQQLDEEDRQTQFKSTRSRFKKPKNLDAPDLPDHNAFNCN